MSFLGPLDDNDGEIVEFRMGQEPKRFAPARRAIREGALATADPVLRICVHELARALEEYARKEYVPLFNTEADFEVAAADIASRLTAEKCPLKH